MENLTVTAKEETLLHGVNLTVKKGEAVGLTGPSGAGKTTILRALMGILAPPCRIIGGGIFLDDVRLDTLPPRRRRQYNGATIGFIPQNPMTAFDPRLRIEDQILETLRIKTGLYGERARVQICRTFDRLQLSDAQRVLKSYPAQLSGGMLQRIAAALLLLMEPAYIVADEPTSALDEENRRVLVHLLQEQKPSSGILLVSHDIQALRGLCDTLVVLAQGRVIQTGATEDVLRFPEHQWTKQFAQAEKQTEEGTWQWKAL